jgi:hypothetical protein
VWHRDVFPALKFTCVWITVRTARIGREFLFVLQTEKYRSLRNHFKNPGVVAHLWLERDSVDREIDAALALPSALPPSAFEAREVPILTTIAIGTSSVAWSPLLADAKSASIDMEANPTMPATVTNIESEFRQFSLVFDAMNCLYDMLQALQM